MQMRKDVRAVTSFEKLQSSCQFKKVKISGEMLRNGGKRAAVNRTKFAIPATKRRKKRSGWTTGHLTKPKMQSRCFGWCNTVNQPLGKEEHTKNLVFAYTDARGPKATENNRKNISSPQVAQTAEETSGAGVGEVGHCIPQLTELSSMLH